MRPEGGSRRHQCGVHRADARYSATRDNASKVDVAQANFFLTDWERVLSDLPEPILVLGNPPWVTSAQLGVLRSQNLPVKSNFQRHSGLDAITGKANFDISEWMLIRLLTAMSGRGATLAMLCKLSTARKTLCYAWKNNIPLEGAAVYAIDADLHFDAAVDAVLLVAHLRTGGHDREAKVYSDLKESGKPRLIAYEDGMLLADVAAYRQWKHLCGDGRGKVRSGIKHDCAKVMEVVPGGEQISQRSGQTGGVGGRVPFSPAERIERGGQRPEGGSLHARHSANDRAPYRSSAHRGSENVGLSPVARRPAE